MEDLKRPELKKLIGEAVKLNKKEPTEGMGREEEDVKKENRLKELRDRKGEATDQTTGGDWVVQEVTEKK